MNSKDKTREKLVASMRKSKTAKAEQQPTKDATVTPAQHISESTTGDTQATRVFTKSTYADAYQSGRRVWPD